MKKKKKNKDEEEKEEKKLNMIFAYFDDFVNMDIHTLLEQSQRNENIFIILQKRK